MKKTARPRERTDLIAACGLFCGDCPRLGGNVSGLAQQLRTSMTAGGFDRFATMKHAQQGPFEDFPAFWKVLKTVAEFECAGCRKNGCSVNCSIRPCCAKRGIMGCWDCAEYRRCPGPRSLARVHGPGFWRNLKALHDKGPERFICGPRCWLGRTRT